MTQIQSWVGLITAAQAVEEETTVRIQIAE